MMTIYRPCTVLACGVALALGACGDATTVPVPGEAELNAYRTDAAEKKAEENAKALTDFRGSLKRAQEALAAAQAALAASNEDTRRGEAKEAVDEARKGLEEIQPDLAAQLTGADKAAVNAVIAALGRVAAALEAPGTTASGGTVSLAAAHDTLAVAQAALDDAQVKVTEALNADLTGAVMTVLTQAQATLTAAHGSMVPLPRQEQVEVDAAVQRGMADTYDPRVSLTDALLPREERSVPRGKAQSITRTPRTDTGEAGWAKLVIQTDGVAWADGKGVGSASGGLAATDELPLRSVTLRAAGRHPVKIQGDDGTPTTYSNTDGVLQSSLQLSADGTTLKFGGEGVVYYDMQRQFDYFRDAAGTRDHDAWWMYGPDGKLGDAGATAGGTITASHARDLGLEDAGGTLSTEQATALQGYVTDNGGACWQADLSLCGDWAHDDLAVVFGQPSRSPHGDPSYYWKVQAPFTQKQRDTGLPSSHVGGAGGGRSQDLGNYELWLSSYGGLDTGADADDASDDAPRYLEYAGYGLFQVFDNVKAAPSFVRMQAFAFGYDAFRDENDRRTTDLAESIAATFEGRTTARALVNSDDETFITLSGATPLRGDITLNACIGAGACTGAGIPSTANKISGMIFNLQELRHDGVWIPYNIGNAVNIPMAEGDIAADGSFGGQLGHPQSAAGNLNTWDFDAGPTTSSKYAGNFYGPSGGLEAAGWWHMKSDYRRRATRGSLIGSFGAKCTEGCD